MAYWTRLWVNGSVGPPGFKHGDASGWIWSRSVADAVEALIGGCVREVWLTDPLPAPGVVDWMATYDCWPTELLVIDVADGADAATLAEEVQRRGPLTREPGRTRFSRVWVEPPQEEYEYPLVPPRAALDAIRLSEVEQSVLWRLWSSSIKGYGESRLRLARFYRVSPQEMDATLASLRAVGAVLFDNGPQHPRVSFLGEHLLGSQSYWQYTYQAVHRARQRVMWDRALDRADAAGRPVTWTGDQPFGVDDSIPVPEVEAVVDRLHREADDTPYP